MGGLALFTRSPPKIIPTIAHHHSTSRPHTPSEDIVLSPPSPESLSQRLPAVPASKSASSPLLPSPTTLHASRRAMASRGDNHGFQLPIPPPPLHTRSSNDGYGRPRTPTQEAFMSPQQTPQGSPSKHHQPPGAFDLPNVFENAMRLLPTMGSPSKSGRQPQSPTSPNKSHAAEDVDYSGQDLTAIGPSSPTRKANKENTPPSSRPGMPKETSFINHAAASRQEPYKTREAEKQTLMQQRLSPEELEKLRKPAVKRLANVTQLCKFGICGIHVWSNDGRFPGLLL